MKGLLIVNHFLNTNKFSNLHKFILESAKNNNVKLTIMTNLECMVEVEKEPSYLKDIDFVLFWDKDMVLARYLEKLGLRLFNKREAIQICDDKALTHIELSRASIRMPKTIVAPMTYDNIGYNDTSFLDTVAEKLGFPMVVKERFGSFGMQVYKAENFDELINIFNEYGNNKLIFQEYIKSSKGRDIRLQVVGDTVVTAMYRYSDIDFRANITNGGKAKLYNPSDEQKSLAIKVCEILGLDFAGVDLLFGENDEPIICEVNSNAHVVNIYDCTKVNVCDYIFEHIRKTINK